jgi:hypothetical protein
MYRSNVLCNASVFNLSPCATVTNTARASLYPLQLCNLTAEMVFTDGTKLTSSFDQEELCMHYYLEADRHVIHLEMSLNRLFPI